MPIEKSRYESAVEQLLLHEKQLNLIYNTVKDVLYMLDVEPGGKFKFTSVNFSFLEVTGLEEHQVIGKYVDEVIPPSSIGLVLGKYREAIETASTVTWEEISEYPRGKKYGMVSITPVFDKSGECIRMVGSVHDVTEKREQEIAINKVNLERETAIAQLIDRNKTLEQYTYVVSHNLRAPLANILGLVEILKGSNLGDADIQDAVNDISESISKLDNVVSDLNAILQVRERNTERKELVSLQQIIDDISLSIADVIKQERVTINSECAGHKDIYSIRSHLYSIFYNLILNSIKFRKADEAPVINISCLDSEDATTIVFRDNGKGIDLKQHSGKLFRLYKRFDMSVKGKGIGLFLVKTQVEDLNGCININSELNRGTEFTISLPKESDQAAEHYHPFTFVIH